MSSKEVGLKGDIEIQIPKSINRLRLSGACMQFVHGGMTLQEVVLPILIINKKRQSDISWVDIEIIRGATNVITSGQLAVVLYQSQPASDKVKPRNLRIGIHSELGELVSDRHDIIFDKESDNPRDREFTVRFVMTQKANESNNKDVILKLEEKIFGTNYYKEYKTLRYQMRRLFTSDFNM